MKNKKILISGAGVAGLTLAYFLKEHGFEPTIIERASTLRDGGYMIDFFASGIFVAKEMGINDELAKRNHNTLFMRQFNAKGKETLGLNVASLKDHLESKGEGGFYNFLRTDLVDALYQHIKPSVPVRFSTSIKSVTETNTAVEVTFNDNSQETFDLLVGADGIHSNIRKLVFPSKEIEQLFLGYYVAGLSHNIAIPNKHKGEIISHIQPKKQIMTYEIAEGGSNSLFVLKSDKLPKLNHQEKVDLLRKEFKDFVEPVSSILNEAAKLDKLYFDEVSQIRIKGAWNKSRTILVGDAAYCITLLSGQGASMAMTGAYVLAQQLIATKGEYQQAFSDFEKALRPKIESMQQKAVKNAASYLPSSSFALWLRNLLAPILFTKLFSPLVIKQLGAYNYFEGKTSDQLIPKTPVKA